MRWRMSKSRNGNREKQVRNGSLSDRGWEESGVDVDIEQDLERKAQRLLQNIEELGGGGLLVAYSGGVDSSLLAAAALRAGVERVELAGCYTLLHREADRDAAETGSRELGLPLHRLAVDLTALPAVMENHRDRCYHCKRVLFRRMWETAQQRALGALAEGANAEDVTAYRPGLQAGAEWGVARPLAAAGLTKKDVRTLARIWGLSCWNRPSSPCLASRFPYDTPLTRPALERVAAGESLLAQAGLVDVRLRCHGDLARIECRPEQAPFLLAQSKTLVPALKGLGFSYITYDLEGFRSGSFDR